MAKTYLDKVGTNGALKLTTLDASDNIVSVELLSEKLYVNFDASVQKVTSFVLKEFDRELSNGANYCSDFYLGDNPNSEPFPYIEIDSLIATAELYYNS